VASDSLILIDARHVEEDCQKVCLMLTFCKNAFIVPISSGTMLLKVCEKFAILCETLYSLIHGLSETQHRIDRA